MLKDLKRSGLTETDAKKLGCKLLSQKQTQKLTGNFATAYQIPYHGIDGKPVKEFWRVRYLEEIKGKFGATLSKPMRYTGPKNKLPRLYFPKNFGNWKAVAKDPEELIVFTEGEKKAAKLCKHGIPCISVPGVWAWKSKKKNVRLIKDFQLIDWTDRAVAMAFDNDMLTNPKVIGALNALAGELVKLGAHVVIIHLPEGELKGVDDFVVARGIDAFLELPETPFANSQALWEFNERCAFIGTLNFIYDLETRRNYDSQNKLMLQFANAIHYVPKADGEGVKPVKTALEWLAWEHRRQYATLEYYPGEPIILEERGRHQYMARLGLRTR